MSNVFSFLNQPGKGELPIDDADDFAQAWLGEAKSEGRVGNTQFTTADVREAMQGKEWVKAFPELATELLARQPHLRTKDALEYAFAMADGQIQMRYKENFDLYEDAELAVEAVQDEAQYLGNERLETLYWQAEEERERIQDEAAEEIEAYMQEHGHEVTPESFNLAIAAVVANPNLSVVDAFAAAQRGEQEIERVVAEGESVLGIMEKAKGASPITEDVEFVDTTPDTEYILTGERQQGLDPYAPYLDQLDVEGMMKGEYSSPVGNEWDRLQQAAYDAGQAAKVKEVLGPQPDRAKPIERDNLAQFLKDEGVEAVEG